MKILFLNPHIDAEQKLIDSLRRRGDACILTRHPLEALHALKFHGRSVDLAIIHREAGVGEEGAPGFDFIQRIKADPDQRDLPLIITTGVWKDAECAAHQKTPQGAHAYLRYPFTEQQLQEILEKMFGAQLRVGAAELLSEAGQDLVLEDVDSILGDGEEVTSATSIRLEMPAGLEDEAEPEPVKPKDKTKTRRAEKTRAKAKEPESEPELDTSSLFSSSRDPEEEQPTESLESPDQAQPEGQAGKSGGGLFDTRTLFKQLVSSTLEEEEQIQAIQQEALPRATTAEEEYLAREMPYLFTQAHSSSSAAMDAVKAAAKQAYDFTQPVGDAVVPGGAHQAPDLETLKRYLLLREQDVAALSIQLKAAKDQLTLVEQALREEKGRVAELEHVVKEQSERIGEFEKEKRLSNEALQAEIDELKFQSKVKAERARKLEARVREATVEMERLKERVRGDIRKIRVREKDLENRLEIMKKDSEALIAARENKIIELKRKVDLLEFNMDLLQDQYQHEKENSAKLKERLTRALQAVRVAGGLLDAARPAEEVAAEIQAAIDEGAEDDAQDEAGEDETSELESA